MQKRPLEKKKSRKKKSEAEKRRTAIRGRAWRSICGVYRIAPSLQAITRKRVSPLLKADEKRSYMRLTAMDRGLQRIRSSKAKTRGLVGGKLVTRKRKRGNEKGPRTRADGSRGNRVNSSDRGPKKRKGE